MKLNEKETYCCDGLNENCTVDVPYDEVFWFTSRLGFCPHCAGKLLKLPVKIFNFLYDLCEGNDEEAIDFVVGLTE